MTTSITIIIPIYNRKTVTLTCLQQLQTIVASDFSVNIIVVDDGSTDGSSKAIREHFPDVTVLHGNGNLWWSGATNLGVKYALQRESDFVLTLNDDVEIKLDFLQHLVSVAKHYPNSIVCPVVCQQDKKHIILSAGRFRKGFLAYRMASHLRGKPYDALTDDVISSELESGYAMLIPAHIFRSVGLFDSKHFPHHMGDMDFVLRARMQGVQVKISTKAIIYTRIGENYFHNKIVSESLWNNIKSFFDLKSTINLRTRWFFDWYHTPYHLGLISYLFFIGRMCAAITLKKVLSPELFRLVITRRT